MADGTEAPAPAAGTPQEPADGTSLPPAAPAVAPEPAPAPAAPEPAPAPPAEPAPAEPAAPAAAAPEPTLLQKHDAEVAAAEAAAKPAEPAKPADAPAAKPADPAEPPKPGEAPAAEAAAPATPEPVEYKYELPETIQMDDATRGSFHTALDAFRADPAAGAQGLIDLHNQTMQQYADHLQQEQVRVWNETRKAWQTEVMADEQLGGAGFQTTMGAIARMRDLLVAEPHRAAFDNFLTVTGAGDHPEFLRILHNAARIYDEAPMAPPNARPPATNGAAPARGLRSLYKPSTPRGQ